MLVLSRKIGQEIRIGDTVSVSVVRVRGNRVQLGIQAPEGIAVYRTEIIDGNDDCKVAPAMTSRETPVAAACEA